MANSKISALPAASTPLAGAELVPVVQGGITEQVSVANLTVGRTVTMGSLLVNPAADTNASGTISAIPRTTAGQSEAALNLQAYSRETTNNRQAQYTLRVDPDNDFGAATFKIDYSYDGTPYGTRWSVDSSGNWAQGVASKGVNFRANTPAAGMTSQLLNWYEEGTWTPVFTAGVGSLTSYTVNSATYTRTGRILNVNFDVTITNNGTSSVYIAVTGMPFNVAGGANASMGTIREVAIIGSSGVVYPISTTQLLLVDYKNTYPGGTGARLVGSLNYNT